MRRDRNAGAGVMAALLARLRRPRGYLAALKRVTARVAGGAR